MLLRRLRDDQLQSDQRPPGVDVVAVSFDIAMTMAGADKSCTSAVSRCSPSTEDGLISAVTAYWGDEDVSFE